MLLILEQAKKIIAGTARSMGVDVIEVIKGFDYDKTWKKIYRSK